MMKTEKECNAEITSDVKKAIWERAVAEFSKQEAHGQELKTKRKTSNEKLSSFYHKVSLLFLTGSGVGGLSPTLITGNSQIDWFQVSAGVTLSAFFAILGNHVINK